MEPGGQNPRNPQVTAVIDWTGPGWYLVKWLLDGAGDHVSAWPEASAEPSSWMAWSSYARPSTGDFTVSVAAPSGSLTKIDFIAFDH